MCCTSCPFYPLELLPLTFHWLGTMVSLLQRSPTKVGEPVCCSAVGLGNRYLHILHLIELTRSYSVKKNAQMLKGGRSRTSSQLFFCFSSAVLLKIKESYFTPCMPVSPFFCFLFFTFLIFYFHLYKPAVRKQSS